MEMEEKTYAKITEEEEKNASQSKIK